MLFELKNVNNLAAKATRCVRFFVQKLVVDYWFCLLFSIIGFMSDWVSNMTFPRMSFVKQNLKEMGCQTFLLLHDLLNGSESVKSIVINSQLNIRDSTRNNF